MTIGDTHVVLVGLMGTGKSTIGKRLAKSLRRPFLDSDALIENRTGRSVRQIFADDGEDAFRAVEQRVLRDALNENVPAVIAAAGGVVLDASNRAAINEKSWTIWLQCDPAVLAKRVASGTHRPLLDDDPEGTLTEMSTVRADLYAEVADVVLDVTPLSMDAAGDEVERIVQEALT